ncbi:hypothetical protein OPT61_g10383 [Boeremia exigua]|uniref:Uncharacterized protein n=1 Tax=Boeremia exigua TaxID=749465 RepID=A0ACC2HQH1_9PLEO|nr:hypothetical protein OPT61_g10383 [Boeremia exigua]
MNEYRVSAARGFAPCCDVRFVAARNGCDLQGPRTIPAARITAMWMIRLNGLGSYELGSALASAGSNGLAARWLEDPELRLQGSSPLLVFPITDARAQTVFARDLAVAVVLGT